MSNSFPSLNASQDASPLFSDAPLLGWRQESVRGTLGLKLSAGQAETIGYKKQSFASASHVEMRFMESTSCLPIVEVDQEVGALAAPYLRSDALCVSASDGTTMDQVSGGRGLSDERPSRRGEKWSWLRASLYAGRRPNPGDTVFPQR
jgi:hypothetical protein